VKRLRRKTVAEPRLNLINDLIKGVDNLDGARIPNGPYGGGVVVVTLDQVREWLVEEKYILLDELKRGRRAPAGEQETDR
jgi:hypothetical protein